ncbi:hypothetical protein SAMN05660197_0929 [Nitratiruptor tergarcus DSM 16512]|uniref:Uncharacterized protein n=1 Tax=Nitratiruptor tergarcus DSM 16512 TaxID=1069081 RepID=A0A1W1WS56_9BACT|nr:hypothetical protein SAMN05660197_0929 [Nitratiruptor tergarcus DSM 16512]
MTVGKTHKKAKKILLEAFSIYIKAKVGGN